MAAKRQQAFGARIFSRNINMFRGLHQGIAELYPLDMESGMRVRNSVNFDFNSSTIQSRSGYDPIFKLNGSVYGVLAYEDRAVIADGGNIGILE